MALFRWYDHQLCILVDMIGPATPELRIEQLGTVDESWQAFVTRRMDGWLRAERNNTVAGHNRVLNEYADRREAYTNLNKSKAGGHFIRYRLFMSLLDKGFYEAPASPKNDRVGVAKAIHFSMMFPAGGALGEQNLRARSLDTYEELRYGSTHSANDSHSAVTNEAVAKGIWLGVDDGVAQARKALRGNDMHADMREFSLEANETIKEQYVVELPKMLGSDFPAGVGVPADHEVVDALHTVQRLGVGLAVAHLAVALEVRGDVGAVPVLWPDSISVSDDRPLVYPFAPAEPDYNILHI